MKRLRPEIAVVGVEPRDADALARSLRAGRRVTLPHVGLFADGVAVRQVGKEPFRLARKYVDEVVLVDTDELCAGYQGRLRGHAVDRRALRRARRRRREALGRRSRRHREDLVSILCGANMNFDRLRFIAERAELGEQREAVFAATIPERPGSFKAFCSLIGKRNVTEFNYRYDDPVAAHVFVGVEVRNLAEKERILASLDRHGIETLDLSENEMAKLHVRHLVGGRAPQARHELLYRFEFPERPGALMRFLNSMGESWNISLFHYRNHGADYGRVLAGIQVPPEDGRRFEEFLDGLGYASWDESENPAYKLFLEGRAPGSAGRDP